MMGEDRQLHVGRALARLHHREQGQALDHRMEDEGDEGDLGRDPEAVHPAAGEEAGPEHPRHRFENPGKREAGGDPDEGLESEAGQDLGHQMEPDDAEGGREGEGAGQLEQDGSAAGGEGEDAPQDRRARDEQDARDHRRLLRHAGQRPRNSRTCASMRNPVARRTSESARSRAREWNSRARPQALQTIAWWQRARASRQGRTALEPTTRWSSPRARSAETLR